MKAKEYAYKIIRSIELPEDEFNKILYSVVIDLFAELTNLIKTRHCACDSAFIAVFDEIDNKWVVISRIVNKQLNNKIIKPTGFRDLAFKVADNAGLWQMRRVWKPKKLPKESND